MKKGDRILFKINGTHHVREGRVMEFSPTGKYVKLGGDWFVKADVSVVEELPAGNKKANGDEAN